MQFHRPPPRVASSLLLIAALLSVQLASAQNLVVGSNSTNQSTNFSTGTNSYSNTYVGFATNSSNNSITVANTNTLLTNSAAFDVGYDGSSNSLIISNGAGVYDQLGTVGLNVTSSNNSVLASGIGSFWKSSTNYIGFNGSGNSLIISNGAGVYALLSDIGLNSTSSNNLVLVTGNGSLWSNSTLYLGVYGSGNQLVVSNGASIIGSGHLGSLSGSSNNAAVVTGTNSLWSSGATINIGDSGTGNSLLISAGAKVNGTTGVIGAEFISSGNYAIVTGTGSSWSNSSTLNVGYKGSSNSLVITNGASVKDAFGQIAYYSNSVGNQVWISGSNSLWSNSTILYVGVNGSSNSVTITNGGSVYGQYGSVGYYSPSTSNSILVTGVGSTWSNGNSTYVGYSGSGNGLVISNGAKTYDQFGSIGYSSSSSNNSVLVTGSGSLWSNGVTLNIGNQGGGTLTIANGGYVVSKDTVIASDTNSSGSLNFGSQGGSDNAGVITTATLAFGSGNGTINFNQKNAFTLSNTISGNGSVNQLGTGTTILSGSNSYMGATRIQAGTLAFSGTNALYGGNTAQWTAANLIVSRGATALLAVAGTNAFTADTIATLAAIGSSNGGFLNGSYLGLDSTGTNFTYSSALANPNGGSNALGLNIFGTGTVTLTQSNSYSGGTKLYGGTLVIGNSQALATGPLTVAFSGTLSSLTNLGLANSIDILADQIATFEVNSSTLSIAGVIANAGSLAKAGSGTLILTAANSYQGGTIINDGTLSYGGAANRLATNGAVTLNNNSTLDLGGFSNTVGMMTLASGVITNGVLNATSFNARSGTVYANLAGSGSLSESGIGTLFLLGNNSYSGRTSIGTGSSLSLGTTGTLAGTTSVLINGGSLLLGGNSRTNPVSASATLQLSGGTLSMGGTGATARLASQTLSTLTLTASSVIDFAALSGTSSLTFGGISGLGSGNQLSIWNWNGTPSYGPTSTTGGLGAYTHIYDSIGTLSSAELAAISFYSGSGSGFLGTGTFSGTEIVPVPEPAVIMTVILLLGSLAFFRLHRQFSVKASSAGKGIETC